MVNIALTDILAWYTQCFCG